MGHAYNIERTNEANKVRGFVISLIIHSGLLLLFLFMYLTPPNPPLSDITTGGGGTELNYGDPLAGTNDLSNLLESDPSPDQAEVATSPSPDLEEAVSEPSAEDVETIEATPSESEDAVEVQAKEKPATKTETKVVKTAETKTTPPAPKIDDKFVMNKSTGTKSGDDKGTAGDPGQKEGTTDGRALMGKPGKGGGTGGGTGTGNGPSIGGGLSGWRFVSEPKVNDQTAEKGTLKFKIYVNDEGIIEKADVIENLGGITPKLQLVYKNALEGLELTNSTGIKMPPRSIGTVTWDINPN